MQAQQGQLPQWLGRGVSDIFPSGSDTLKNDDLLSKLEESRDNNKPLRIKLGIDPTGSEIHLGHSILFRKLRSFQDKGHTAILIIGDFTARIGDPTGKSKTRVQLEPDQINHNASTYLEQLGYGQLPDKSLLDFSTPGRLEIHRNSEWFKGFDLASVIDLLGQSTVGQMLAKEDFSKRYSSGTPISLHEFLYPLLQGYDSFAVNADLEIGGTDQKFNVAMGRDVQRHFGQDPQYGLLLPILNGLDGSQKMSKSLNNLVGIKEDPLSMYSKLEKLDDNSVTSYITLLTDLDLNNLPTDPRQVQKLMALTITSNFHGIEAASAAQANSEKLVLGLKANSDEVQEVSIADIKFPVKAFYLLSAIGLSPSSSEAKRQIQGGSVRLEGEKIDNPSREFVDRSQLLGKVLQIGKKTFRKVID